MKKIVITTALLFGLFGVLHGQIEEKMKNEKVVQGSIVNKNGEEIEGYIKAKGDVFSSNAKKYFPAPWEYQDDIKFISKDVFENTEQLKGKMYKKYGPKDILAYRYEDMYFEAVKYADMSSVGLNMFAKWMFLRKVIDGKMEVFYHYVNPPSVISAKESFETYYVTCAEEHVVYRKGKDVKLKLIDGVAGINIHKNWEDCPYVKEKYDQNEYSGSKIEICLKAIQDYNENCN
jgi:hypothetical protein